VRIILWEVYGKIAGGSSCADRGKVDDPLLLSGEDPPSRSAIKIFHIVLASKGQVAAAADIRVTSYSTLCRFQAANLIVPQRNTVGESFGVVDELRHFGNVAGMRPPNRLGRQLPHRYARNIRTIPAGACALITKIEITYDRDTSPEARSGFSYARIGARYSVSVRATLAYAEIYTFYR
jgi:hypothetical protein